jgi:hypothetical protein
MKDKNGNDVQARATIIHRLNCGHHDNRLEFHC